MTRMRRIALVLVLAVLAPAEAAQAGGWATIELGEAPSGLVAGKPWRVELIVKQHGQTLLDDAAPTVRIVNGRGVERTFPAHRIGPGRYVAEVTFPSAGTWRTRIFDGWTDAVPHRLSPLTVAAAPGDEPSRFPWEQAVAIAVVALLWAWGLYAAGDTVPARERRAARGRRRATPRAVA
jgi:hypothetical protein